MKLELGAGHRPTRGYSHHDAYPFAHIEHVGDPWMLDLPDNSVEEVLALGFIEHLTYDQARDTFRNVHRMLVPGGVFLFDVPDLDMWARYYCYRRGFETGMGEWETPPLDDVLKTLYGWQRWPGDEHKSGWHQYLVNSFMGEVGYRSWEFDVAPFQQRAYRRRFFNTQDTHLYVTAVK